ncbi:MAG: RNA polymerase sigma-54 factor, partial [Acidobacteriales bacterium]|nr:RNA polymerase sigma-54 factor [Terriglobales bacterium]
MALLQPRLNLKVAQKQVLTPGLVQMVSLLALNKQELKEMIDAEILENPVLEELEESVPLIDDARTPEEAANLGEEKKEDPFDEIDFGSYFQDYLDPGYRTPQSSEINEKPSFENFLSKPTTLTDHMMWQLGSLHLKPGVCEAAELVIGNLNEDGYLTASDEELLAALAKERKIQTGLEEGEQSSDEEHPVEYPATLKRDMAEALQIVRKLDPVGIAARDLRECLLVQLDARSHEAEALASTIQLAAAAEVMEEEDAPTIEAP